MNNDNNHNRRWMTILLGLAGIALLVAIAMRPEKIPVEVTKVERGTVEVNVYEDGITRVRERYTVIAPISGKMVRLEVHPGDSVALKGNPIVILEPTDSALLDPRTKLESQERVKAAQASILRADQLRSVAKETLELAEHEYGRVQELKKSNSVSQSEFEAIEHRFRIANAELRASEFLRSVAEHELGVAQAVLDAAKSQGGEPMRIGSPIDGLVLRVLRQDAGFVTAGTPLIEIGDPRDMELQIDVLSSAAVSIVQGSRVLVRGWGGSQQLSGRVRRVEPSAFLKISALGVEERRVLVLIDLDEPWENRQGLGDGFRVTANILVNKSNPNVLTVPTASLESSKGKSYVYRIEASSMGGYRARRVAVQVGLSSRQTTEIVSGLEFGDPLVLYPPETIRDGSWVSFDDAGSDQ